MAEFWKRADRFWNQNPVLAWALLLTGIGLVVWAFFSPQSPGVSIGLLALAAGLMSIRPKMHPAEKTVWVVVLVAFAFLEVHAIKVGDTKNEETRDAQNKKFDGIADGLKASIQAGKDQFDATTGNVNGVLKTTQHVASLAERSLENITGGRSFAYVTPQVGFSPIPFSIYNDGDYILTGVAVNVRKGLIEADNPDTIGIFGKEIQIGTLAPHEFKIIPFLSLVPRHGQSGLDVYEVTISAQNFSVEQHLVFRKATKDSAWAYKYTVTRQLVRSHIGNTINFKYQVLKERPWSDGSSDQQQSPK